MSDNIDTIEMWRYERLKLAVAKAMDGASSLVCDLEMRGELLDSDDKYHITVELLALLAQGQKESTEV